jgi:hypothetical protein
MPNGYKGALLRELLNSQGSAANRRVLRDIVATLDEAQVRLFVDRLIRSRWAAGMRQRRTG